MNDCSLILLSCSECSRGALLDLSRRGRRLRAVTSVAVLCYTCRRITLHNTQLKNQLSESINTLASNCQSNQPPTGVTRVCRDQLTQTQSSVVRPTIPPSFAFPSLVFLLYYYIYYFLCFSSAFFLLACLLRFGLPSLSPVVPCGFRGR